MEPWRREDIDEVKSGPTIEEAVERLEDLRLRRELQTSLFGTLPLGIGERDDLYFRNPPPTA
jgi:hypothetical protein